MEGKRDALLFDKPPVGLAPAEAELAANKAAAGFFSSSFFRPGGRKKEEGAFGAGGEPKIACCGVLSSVGSLAGNGDESMGYANRSPPSSSVRPLGRTEEDGGQWGGLVAQESWPRRHKADGGQEGMPWRAEERERGAGGVW